MSGLRRGFFSRAITLPTMEVSQLETKQKASKLIDRYSALKQERDKFESLWKDAGKYIHPRREFLFDGENASKRNGQTRYSSYAVKANQTHADGLQGYLVAPSIQWFKLKFRRAEMADIPYAKDWLERCEEEIYGIFRATNYYAAMGEFLLDAGSICTSYMYTEYDKRRETVMFKTINPGECVIAEDESGMVNTVYREFSMTAEQMREKFEYIPEDVQSDLDNFKPDETRRILHAVETRTMRDETKEDNKNLPFASYYIDSTSQEILSESGYHEFPYLCLRFRKASGEIYGRGPGLDCIEEILRLNQFSKGQLQLAQLMVEPPLNIPAAMKGKVKYAPRAKNYTTQNSGKIEPVTVPGNYSVGEAAMDKIEKIIDDFYNVGFFRMLQQAERQMTAREIIERQGEKATILSSAVGRLYQECLNPLIQRVFGMLHRAGKIPAPPMEIIQMGAKLDVELIGPLAMAQKYYAKTQGITKGIEGIAPLVQFDQTVLDYVDFGVMAKELLDAAGTPQKAIKEEHEVKEIRKRRAAAQQQQAQLEQMQQMADAVPKLNQKVEEGSPLQAIDEQLAAGVSPGGRPA